jgi:hypothetical protein
MFVKVRLKHIGNNSIFRRQIRKHQLHKHTLCQAQK